MTYELSTILFSSPFQVFFANISFAFMSTNFIDLRTRLLLCHWYSLLYIFLLFEAITSKNQALHESTLHSP